MCFKAVHAAFALHTNASLIAGRRHFSLRAAVYAQVCGWTFASVALQLLIRLCTCSCQYGFETAVICAANVFYCRNPGSRTTCSSIDSIHQH